jgi:hypothetical protein
MIEEAAGRSASEYITAPPNRKQVTTTKVRGIDFGARLKGQRFVVERPPRMQDNWEQYYKWGDQNGQQKDAPRRVRPILHEDIWQLGQSAVYAQATKFYQCFHEHSPISRRGHGRTDLGPLFWRVRPA